MALGFARWQGRAKAMRAMRLFRPNRDAFACTLDSLDAGLQQNGSAGRRSGGTAGGSRRFIMPDLTGYRLTGCSMSMRSLHHRHTHGM